MNFERSEIAAAVHYTCGCLEQHFNIEPKAPPGEVIDDFVRMSANTVPLRSGEHGIVSLVKPKTAALLGDRVWLPFPGADDRLDFAFGWGSPMAIRWAALLALVNITEEDEAKVASSSGSESGFKSFLETTEADLVAEYARLSQASLVPLYRAVQDRERDYSPGDQTVVVTVLENVAMVDEEQLAWEQVLEFRSDPEARLGYRRFLHWLNKEMVGKPASFIVDEVGQRLETYHWVLKKHGLSTVLGTFERILDAKSLVGSAAATVSIQSVLNIPSLSLLSGAGLLVGGVALRTAATLVRLIRQMRRSAGTAGVAAVESGGWKPSRWRISPG